MIEDLNSNEDDNNSLPKRKKKNPSEKSDLINTNTNNKHVKGGYLANSVTDSLMKNKLNNINTNTNVNEGNNNEPRYIYLNVNGIIESASFFTGDTIYCQYEIVSGPDWKIINGDKKGKSQLACQGEGNERIVVWNLPFEVCLQSTNPYGWPQLVISCYNPDFFGRDIVKAYGTVFIPTTPGEHKRKLSTFSTISSSKLIEAIGIFLGEKAELRDPSKVLSTGEGREIIRTKCEGEITVSFNVQLTNMDAFGYNL